jgi:hypothetical protein
MPGKSVRVYNRRVGGPRKSHVRITLRLPFFFVILVVLTAILGIWLNKRFNEAPIMHRLYHARSYLGR